MFAPSGYNLPDYEVMPDGIRVWRQRCWETVDVCGCSWDTHPVLLIYELRFEQKVWVSCHHHHVLQLGIEGEDDEGREEDKEQQPSNTPP